MVPSTGTTGSGTAEVGAAGSGAARAGSSFEGALASARDGDEGAFVEIFRNLHPRMLRYLRVLCGPEAEDVASETWLQIARDIRTFVGDWDGFRAWSITIARHRAIDHERRAQRRPDATIPIESVPERPAADDPADDVADAMATDRALALVASLPREQAEAIMLRVVIGLDARTSARILGRRPGAVRTAAHRGLRTLSQKLDGLDPETYRRDDG